MSATTAGESTCPVCGTTWTVSLFRDCLMPACGCYGHDTSEANPNRVCNSCGMSHALAVPDRCFDPDTPEQQAEYQRQAREKWNEMATTNPEFTHAPPLKEGDSA